MSDMEAEFSAKSVDLKGERMELVTVGAKSYATDVYGIDAIIKPADNVAGAVIRTCSLTGASWAGLVTGTVAPKSATDTVGKPVLVTLGPGAVQQLPYQVQIPAGYGLWITANGGAPSRACVTYDLLP
ncbi:hypothetical protein [Pseudomonas sp. RIT623]|uniref:hypothetical protein n=1 Tax=Pseudomonas sp. RIT623 TaxID=2559075 RepID=UPI0010700665|nr:hypothetical protein [Pseudomonas sp. RIT623]TFF38152.1 hypothetical protein E3U47_17075 [Pseudomonas sp. RIT623]